jgi:hypothetical protein
MAGLQDAAVKMPFLEVQGAPVPLLMRTRPPVVVLDNDTAPVSAPRPEGNSTRSAAKASIEADGYKGVRMLSKGLSGGWHATALRGTTEISITVERKETYRPIRHAVKLSLCGVAIVVYGQPADNMEHTHLFIVHNICRRHFK